MKTGIFMLLLIYQLFAVNMYAQWQATDCEPFRFGVIADVQYCACQPNGTRFYQNSKLKLATCVDTLNTKQLDFVTNLGDVVDHDYASFDSILPLFSKLSVPLHPVLGNHEYQNMNCEQQPLVHTRLGMPAKYYDFVVKKWRFIVLNATDLHRNAYCGGSEMAIRSDSMLKAVQAYQKYNAYSWNGGISNQQLNWFKNRLDLATEQQEKVIILSHMPVFPQTGGNLWNDSTVLSIIDKYSNVVMYLSGHNHEGGYAERKNVHYLIHKGMVETELASTFSVVEVTPNALHFRGYGNETNHTYTFANPWFTETSIVEDTLENEIKISQEPSAKRINITSPSPVKSILLYDRIGQLLKEVNNNNTLSVSGLPTDVYFVKIETNHTNSIRKIVL